jgi:hypothetical protein
VDEFVFCDVRFSSAKEAGAPLRHVFAAGRVPGLVAGDPLGPRRRLVGHDVPAPRQPVLAVGAGRIAAASSGTVQRNVLFGQSTKDLDRLFRADAAPC